MAKRGAEKGSEECPQALKRIEGEPFMSELKLRPPKGPASLGCSSFLCQARRDTFGSAQCRQVSHDPQSSSVDTQVSIHDGGVAASQQEELLQ